MDHEEEKPTHRRGGIDMEGRRHGHGSSSGHYWKRRSALRFQRRESLVCFFFCQNFVVLKSTKQTVENNNNNQNPMAYSLLKAITDAFCGSGIREDKEGRFHSIAGP